MKLTSIFRQQPNMRVPIEKVRQNQQDRLVQHDGASLGLLNELDAHC